MRLARRAAASVTAERKAQSIATSRFGSYAHKACSACQGPIDEVLDLLAIIFPKLTRCRRAKYDHQLLLRISEEAGTVGPVPSVFPYATGYCCQPRLDSDCDSQSEPVALAMRLYGGDTVVDSIIQLVARHQSNH